MYPYRRRMTDVPSFLERCDAYQARSGLSPATISKRVLGNPLRLGQLKSGKLNIGVRTLSDASERLSKLEAALGASAASNEAA